MIDLLMLDSKMSPKLLNEYLAFSYTPYQMLENEQRLHELSIQPEDFLGSLRRCPMSLTISSAFSRLCHALSCHGLLAQWVLARGL